MSTTRADSPYKFLDSYVESDRAIFFGRERETQILLSDVVISGLVLLFAETGTGKTSLIRAGVTPQLIERGYVTFFVRVSEDPALSLREEFARSGTRLRAAGCAIGDGDLALNDSRPLAPQLDRIAQRLEGPIVLFLDQFEEFFLYILPNDRPRALRFISDVAAIQGNRASKIHVVFSMREDFVGKMDVFRDEIPAIFRRESNLRLRPFDEPQARAAIIGPAAAREVVIAKDLEDELVRDLAGPDGVDPTELQIVCDTLWRRRANGRIELDAYHGFSRGEPGTIAESILTQRVEEEFEEFPPERLDLLAELLPRLRTPVRVRHMPTKYVRDLDGLATELNVDREELDALVGDLKRARLVREGVQPNLVELTHDYLVAHLDELALRVRGITPRRALRDAMSAPDPRADRLSAADLDGILDRLDYMDLDGETAEFVLRAALAHGRRAQIEPLLRRCEAAGVDVWSVLREVLQGPQGDAFRAIDLLGGLIERRAEAAQLLTAAAISDEDLGIRVIDVLATKLDCPEAVEALATFLDSEPLRTRARAALVALAGSGDVVVAAEAARALLAHLQAEERAPAETVSVLEAYAAVEVLERALQEDRYGDAEDALSRLASSPNPGVAARAAHALTGRLEQTLGLGQGQGRPALDDPGRSVEAVARLGQLGTLRAVQLLAEALDRDALREDGRRALQRLAVSDNEVVAARARDELRGAGMSSPRTGPDLPYPRSTGPAGGASGRPSPAIEATPDPQLRIVVDLLLEGRVVPFVGSEASVVDRPGEFAWQPGGNHLPTSRELAAYLSEHFMYPYPESATLMETSEFAKLAVGPRPLYDLLHSFLAQDYRPNRLHRVVARVAAILRLRGERLPLVATTAYDDSLERAFADVDEPFESLTYVASGAGRYTFLHRTPDGHVSEVKHGGRSDIGLDETTPIILRLCGGVDRRDPTRDTYLLTADEVADFLIGGAASLPVGIAAQLRQNHLLYLGVSINDWTNRTILRRLAVDEHHYRSWAIVRQPDVIERRLWQERDVEVVDRSLDEYAAELATIVESVAS